MGRKNAEQGGGNVLLKVRLTQLTGREKGSSTPSMFNHGDRDKRRRKIWGGRKAYNRPITLTLSNSTAQGEGRKRDKRSRKRFLGGIAARMQPYCSNF